MNDTIILKKKIIVEIITKYSESTQNNMNKKN